MPTVSPKDIVGKRYGRWVVLTYAGRKPIQHYYECRCDCGTLRNVNRYNLVAGKSEACGCISKEKQAAKAAANQDAVRTRGILHQTWRSMIRRCSDPSEPCYDNYGGRGIRVCERWKSFEAFAADMGHRPDDSLSLHRKDNDGHYEPGNCIWADQVTQCNAKSNNRYLTRNGLTRTVAEWAREIGVEKGVLYSRLLRGWDAERTLTTPLLPKGLHRVPNGLCLRGHAYSEHGYTDPNTGHRRCNVCTAASVKRYEERQKRARARRHSQPAQ